MARATYHRPGMLKSASNVCKRPQRSQTLPQAKSKEEPMAAPLLQAFFLSTTPASIEYSQDNRRD